MSEVKQKPEQTALSLAAQAPQVPTVARDTDSLMGAIIAAGSTPGVNVENIERMMALYERLEAKRSKAEFAAAKVRLTAKLPQIEKRGQATGKNDVKTFKYAEWDDIDDIIRPLLVSEGFDLSFRTGENGGQTTITAVLLHTSGHQEETTIKLPADKTGCKNDVQAVGSTVQYGKKYTAGPLLNLVYKGEDDDGNAAGNGPYIDETQADQLLDLAGTAFTDPAKKAHLIARLCEKFKIENITMLRLKDFRDACQLLNDTITTVKDKARAAAPKVGETK